jgi:predicted PurR-regulated permease PerM
MAEGETKKEKKLPQANPTHPLWKDDTFTPEYVMREFALEMNDDQIYQAKNFFVMADMKQMGFLSRYSFTELLNILKIEVDEETQSSMFDEMDTNGDNQIEFDEFLVATMKHIGDEMREVADNIQMGSMGTTRWTGDQILWCGNNVLIMIAISVVVVGLMYFKFILVPLTTAYFLTFLLSPVMDLFESRPYSIIGGRVTLVPCSPFTSESNYREFKNETRQNAKHPTFAQSCTWTLTDIFMFFRLPHALSVILTLVVAIGTLVGIAMMVGGELGKIVEDEQFMEALEEFVDARYADLNASGINIIRDESSAYTEEEAMQYLSIFIAIFSAVTTVLLLTVYIMFEKGAGEEMFKGTSPIISEIEVMINNYIVLKTLISLVTGILVGIILVISQTPLGIMFGLLSFLLNYIPNVGSMLAIIMPLPIIIISPVQTTGQKALAIGGPCIIQGAIGNAIEPVLFGKSLNMTAISILAALVIWSSVWGIMGAILSVPLLGIQKILLLHANHPLAKYCLMLIREDPTIDEIAEAAKNTGETDKVEIH